MGSTSNCLGRGLPDPSRAGFRSSVCDPGVERADPHAAGRWLLDGGRRAVRGSFSNGGGVKGSKEVDFPPSTSLESMEIEGRFVMTSYIKFELKDGTTVYIE